jgi:hypothetical protein
MGDFTGWEPRQMKRINNTCFTFEIDLLTGFQYFYNFNSEDHLGEFIDFNSPSTENYKTGHINNILVLQEEGKTDIDIFEFEKHNQIKKNIQNELNKQSIDKDEVKIFSEMADLYRFYRDTKEKIGKEKAEQIEVVDSFFK